MHLIFLDEQDLSVLDYGYATDDFDIILDALVPQKSKFTVNKQSLKAKVGDLLIVKENGYPYVGIITSIKTDDKNQTKVETKDFLSLLDVDVPLPTSFSGNSAQFIVNLINNTFKYSGDTYQNVSYLETSVEVVKNCSLTYEADTKENILDLVEEFSKTYGIRLEYEVVLANGKFSKIKIKVVSAKIGITMKSTLGNITDLNVNDTNEVSLNKVYYIPKAENTQHTSQVIYYLTNDGQVVTTAPALKRIHKVKMKYEFYSDKDYSSLLTKATKALIDSSLEHTITFNFSFITNQIEALNDLKVGAIVVFITESKTYETIVSKMEFKGTFNVAKVTLGEYRLSLTDKLKLFDRRSS